MKFKSLMLIKAAVCLVLGLPILLVPRIFHGLFDASLGAGGLFTAREYGVSLLGNLMVTWFARDATASGARRAIILGLCLYDAIGFVVTLTTTITGVLNPLGWLAVVLYLFAAVGFGYFLVDRPQP
jgi:hypothetical protein